MSFEPLPTSLEQGVNRFADEQHISRDEAVLKLIQTGLTASFGQSNAPEVANSRTVATCADDSIAARRVRTAERQANRETLAKIRPIAPDALIGFLAGAPEVAEAIRALAEDRRRQAFGNR